MSAGEQLKESIHNEDKCVLVSTVGLSLVCDQRPRYFQRKEIEYNWYTEDNNHADLVWVLSTDLAVLANEIPNFKRPIIIVTNGDDRYFPYDVEKEPWFQHLLGPNVLHVFAQNCWVKNHPKFHAIPIGLDYHSLNWAEGDESHLWGKPGSTALEQEQELLKCMKESTPFESSDPFQVITNFQLSMDSPERRRIMRGNVYKHLRDVKWMKWLPEQTRLEFWKECGRHCFVVCPPGNGPDTHRAWEVLMLGKVPIIQDLRINQVYDELPVWVIKDWAEFARLTPIDLFQKQQEFISKWDTYNFSKLTLAYWAQYMHSFKAQQ